MVDIYVFNVIQSIKQIIPNFCVYICTSFVCVEKNHVSTFYAKVKWKTLQINHFAPKHFLILCVTLKAKGHSFSSLI